MIQDETLPCAPLAGSKPVRCGGRNLIGSARVYGLPNFLFFGDDTSQARSLVQIAGIRWQPLAIVPVAPTL
jgi:hypothetical protein